MNAPIDLFKDDHPFECLSCAASHQRTLFCQKCFVTNITHVHDRSDFICDKDELWFDSNFQAYGWDVRKTAAGRTWYHHKATNKKTFNWPVELVPTQSQAQPQAQTVPQLNLQLQTQLKPESESHQLAVYLCLPPGWDELKDPDGRTFYRHHRTHQVTWWRPTSGKLVEGWIELRNPDGRPYYFHAESQTRTWDHPGISSLAENKHITSATMQQASSAAGAAIVKGTKSTGSSIKTTANNLVHNKKAQKIAATIGMGMINGILKEQVGISLGNGLVNLIGNEKGGNANGRAATAVTQTAARVVGQIISQDVNQDMGFADGDMATLDMSLDQSQDMAVDSDQSAIQDVGQDGVAVDPTDGVGFDDSGSAMEYNVGEYATDQANPNFAPTVDFQPPAQNNNIQHNLLLEGLQDYRRLQGQGLVGKKPVVPAGNTVRPGQGQNSVQGNNRGVNVPGTQQQATSGKPVFAIKQGKERDPSGLHTAGAHAPSHSNTNHQPVQPTNYRTSNTGHITTNFVHTLPHGPHKPTAVTNNPSGSAATSGNQAPRPAKPNNPLTTQVGTPLVNSVNRPQARPNQMAATHVTTPALNRPGRVPANNSNAQTVTRPNVPGANIIQHQRPNLQPQSLGQQRSQTPNQRPPGGLSNTSQNSLLVNSTLQFATALAQGLSGANHNHTTPVNNSGHSGSNNAGNLATNHIASSHQVVAHATQQILASAGNGNEAYGDQPQQFNINNYQELNQNIDNSANLNMDQGLNQNFNQDMNPSMDLTMNQILNQNADQSIDNNMNQNMDQTLQNYEGQGASLVQDSTGNYGNQGSEEVSTEGQGSGGQGQSGEVYDGSDEVYDGSGEVYDDGSGEAYDGSGEVYNDSSDIYDGVDGGTYDESGAVYDDGAGDTYNDDNSGEAGGGGDYAYGEAGGPDATQDGDCQDQGQESAFDQQTSYASGTNADQQFDYGADESGYQSFTVDGGYDIGGGDSSFVIDSSFVPDQYDDSQDNNFDQQDNFQYGDDSYESKPTVEPNPSSKVNVSIGIDASQPTLDRGIALPSASPESSTVSTATQQKTATSIETTAPEQIATTETTVVAAMPVAAVTSLSAGELSHVTFSSLSGPLIDYDYYEPFEPTYDDLPSKPGQHELEHEGDAKPIPAELADSAHTGPDPVLQPPKDAPAELAASEPCDPLAKDKSSAQESSTSTVQPKILRKRVADPPIIDNPLVSRQAENVPVCESEPLSAQTETTPPIQSEHISQQSEATLSTTSEPPVPQPENSFPTPVEPRYTPFRPPKPEFILPTVSESHYTAFRPAKQPVIDGVQTQSQYTAFRPQQTIQPQPEPQYAAFQPLRRVPLTQSEQQHRHSISFQFNIEPPLTEPNSREAAYDRGSPTPTVSSISTTYQDVEPSAGDITPKDPEKHITSAKEKPVAGKLASVPDYEGSGYGDSDFVPAPQFSASREG
jgi:WW domain